MADTFSVPPHILKRLGLPSLEALCERAGVAPAKRFHTDAFFKLWSAVESGLDARDAGLRFGASGVASGHGVAAIVALHAPDLRTALATLGRYKRLTCPELVEIDVEGAEARVRYRWLQATGDVPRLLVDTTLAALHELIRQGTAGSVTPLRIELARQPMDEELLRNHFGCRVVFGAPCDAMVLEARALDTQFVTADGGAFAQTLEGLEARLSSGEGLYAPTVEVRVAIARQLSEGRQPTLAAVAHRLASSARTLQRRLDENNTSFQSELAAVRRTTARRLLANTELDSIAISMLLGFVEHNSFARAFRTWERTTPLKWRARASEGRAL